MAELLDAGVLLVSFAEGYKARVGNPEAPVCSSMSKMASQQQQDNAASVVAFANPIYCKGMSRVDTNQLGVSFKKRNIS